MKKLICKIIGHRFSYNFGWAPTKCTCERCGKKWKAIWNPDYIAGKSNPIEVPLQVWVEDDLN